MDMLYPTDTLDRLAKANRVRWNGHVLKKNSNNLLGRVLDFDVIER